MERDFVTEWMRGFAEGLSALDAPDREGLLACCARRCAQTGVTAAHKRLFAEVGGDRDEYFRRLKKLGNVCGEVVTPGREYRVIFPECGCDLHTDFGVDTPCLCECSRQSILYVQKCLGAENVVVEELQTVLSGASDCRFRVLFPDGKGEGMER